MQLKRTVITGLGVVSPAGNDKDTLFGNLTSGVNFVREIDSFDASRYQSRHAGMVADTGAEGIFNKRLMKKLDRFSEMSLAAAESALTDAVIDIEAEDRERAGIILGNAIGGWGFAEVELRDLYTGGLREVSPYQATAWFPAAPQGQISIHYAIKGFAKTIISDMASSHLAIGYAARAVATGKADLVLAGGTEAPISPYALLCCNTSGEMSRKGEYTPFDKNRDGYVIGEGAGILVVEEYGRAIARGARIYAEIKGFCHTSDGLDPVNPDPTGTGLARAIEGALNSAGLGPEDIDYLMPAGMAGNLYDRSESNAVRRVFGKNVPAAGITKTLYGNLLGASGALDAITGCMAMSKGIAPTHTGCASPDDGCGWAAEQGLSVEKDIRRVMINSTGRGGVNACIVLERL